MAIYINNLGGNELPLQLNNPQEGESLVWNEQLGAYVNAPAGATPEAVQDIVADMVEVDPDGTSLNLKLVSVYDDVTGKLTFNVVSDNGGAGGGVSNTVVIKENGATRGSVSAINFVGSSINLDGETATITGLLDSVGISNAGTNIGNATRFNFTGFNVDVTNGVASVTAPVDYVLPAATTNTLGGVAVDGTTIVIDEFGVISAVGGGGGGSYTLPKATSSILGGIKIGAGLSIDGNGVVSALTTGDIGSYLTSNGYATQSYVQTQVNNLVNGAPGLLDTLNELAAAIGNDANFSSTMLTSLAGKLSLSGGTMTGSLLLSGAPTQTLEAATKGYVDSAIAAIPTPTTALESLTDVDVTTKTSGQILGWDGTKWIAVNNSGAKGDTGATGPQGPAGLSISSATVSLGGRLLLTLSDNSLVDAGNVSGIKTAAVNLSGELILTKQDNTTINAGSVVGPKGDKGDTGATGATGSTGATGPAGVGFSTATVDGDGFLIITKTDSTTVNAGSVVGPKGDQGVTGAKGDKGDTGATGVSVYQAVVDETGNLIITLDDASQLNAGSVVGPQGPQGVQGPAGRSIASSGVVVDEGGFLQVTLTDGTTINAGYVVGPQGSTGPQGIKGDKGDKGDTGDTGPQGTSYTVNGKTGSVQIYGIGNTTQVGYDLEVDLSNKANKLTTARTISLAGKVTGLTSFDGSSNVSITTALSGVTTNDVSEGSNQYFTQARARAALSSAADGSISALIDYDSATGVIKYRANTSYITEGSNLYFTNTRADARADARIAAASINALADVDTVTTAPTNGQVLTWTGSAWTPSTVSGGSGAVSSVNSKTGAVVLNTDDVTEGTSNLYYTTTRWDQRLSTKTTDNLTEGSTNKYFSNTLARNALAAGTGLSYNSSTGTFTLNANTDQVSEGSANLYFTNSRFDTRFGQSTLSALSDVADTTPTTGQALAWNGSAWAPTTVSSGGGGGTASGIFRAAVQVEYDASGNLSSVSVLNGGISAVIATATSTTATVTFTFTGSVCAPLNIQVYGYQRASNVYVTRSIGSDYTTRTLAAGGTSGSPTAFSAFDPSTNTMTLSLTKALSGASAGVGQTTHCVVQFLLASE